MGLLRLENTYLFNVDDLEVIAKANRAERQREALRAEEIIEAEAEQFVRALPEGDLNAVIGAFRQQAGEMAFKELDRSRKRLGRPERRSGVGAASDDQRHRQQIHPPRDQATA